MQAMPMAVTVFIVAPVFDSPAYTFIERAPQRIRRISDGSL
jgi:hypothetical protein